MRTCKIMLCIFVFAICACKSENSFVIPNDDMEIIANSYTYFDDQCLEVFENAFLKHEVWSEDSKIIDACVFEPKEFLKSKMCDEDGIYLRVHLADSISIIAEYYWYNTCFNDFTPIHFKDERLYLDTMFLVRLYFETELNCGNVKIRGSKSNDKKKNGVFRRRIEDELP